MIHLYTYQNIKIYDTDLLEALRSLGVRTGDTLYIHSDVMVFGRIAIENKDKILPAFVDVLKKVVGIEGALVFPTYSYSYCRKEPFDIQNTPSTVGALTNYFRKEKDTVRSSHPLFSVAVWGKHKEEFLKPNKDSFGPESSFAIAQKLNAKILLLGVGFESCTFLHYVEQEHQVPYRFIKTFDGTFIDREGRAHADSCIYFVRPLDEDIDNDMTRITPYLREKGLVRETTIGNGSVSVIGANDLYGAAMHQLDNDPYFLLKQAPS